MKTSTVFVNHLIRLETQRVAAIKRGQDHSATDKAEAVAMRYYLELLGLTK